MRTHRGLLVPAVTILIAAAIAGGASRAYAEGPSQQGWWWQGNPGAVPEAGASVSQPPPDVPSNGLLIEGGSGSSAGTSNSAPTAFAAVVYELPTGGTVSTLTLNVAPNAATTPSVRLQLCPLGNDNIEPQQGGSIGEAPSYRCNTNVTAQASSSGDTYTFDVAKLAAADSLAVAILPTTPTDRVVLSQPTANSLVVRPGGTGTDNDVPAQQPTGMEAAGDGNIDQSSSSGAGLQPSSSDSPAAAAGQAAGGAALSGSPPVIAGPETPSTGAASSSGEGPGAGSDTDSFTPTASDTTRARPVAVVLILVAFVIGAATWLAAGRAAARYAVRPPAPS